MLDAVVLSPLPFRDPGRLVWVLESDGQGRRRPPAATTLVEWRNTSQTIEAVDGMGGIIFVPYQLSRRGSDPQFADDLAAVDAADRPAENPWDS